MIYTSENNWYSWNYDDIPFIHSTDKNQKFTTKINAIINRSTSFKEALINNSLSIVENYPDMRPNIMFSGGADSDVALRTFKEIGTNPKAYIFRYENSINQYDVDYAERIAIDLNVEYRIIDFNLKKFFESDAEKISEIAQIDQAQALPQLKFMDYVDGLVVYAASDPSWFRPNDNYEKKTEWLMRCWEHDIGWSKYAKYMNRPAVMEWWKWTPELVLAFTQTEWFKKLTNDEYYGKLGINSTKLIGYKEAYPNLIDRIKKTGLEKSMDLITEFESFLQRKNGGLIYRRFYDRTLTKLHNDFINYK